MYKFLVRVFMTESRFMDTVVHADTWFNAHALGIGQSPINKAIYLHSL